jgi:hypothetical protein
MQEGAIGIPLSLRSLGMTHSNCHSERPKGVKNLVKGFHSLYFVSLRQDCTGQILRLLRSLRMTMRRGDCSLLGFDWRARHAAAKHCRRPYMVLLEMVFCMTCTCLH